MAVDVGFLRCISRGSTSGYHRMSVVGCRTREEEKYVATEQRTRSLGIREQRCSRSLSFPERSLILTAAKSPAKTWKCDVLCHTRHLTAAFHHHIHMSQHLKYILQRRFRDHSQSGSVSNGILLVGAKWRPTNGLYVIPSTNGKPT